MVRRGSQLTNSCLVLVVCALCAASPSAVFASANAPGVAPGAWTVLRQLELEAIRDYEYHNVSPDVAQRAALLLKLSTQTGFRIGTGACGSAARTLSYMITGYVETTRRQDVSRDWHHFKRRYLLARAACAKDLDVDADQYRLPYWFVW
ncbi:MAG: hypothetical protein AAFR55_00045 [Pseudomonadota bacterium]